MKMTEKEVEKVQGKMTEAEQEHYRRIISDQDYSARTKYALVQDEGK